MFLGYQDPKTLPVKIGTRVRIKKGTPISQKIGTRPAGRTYLVTVHHVTSGVTMTIGDVDEDGTFYWRQQEKDLYGIMEFRGLPLDDTSLETLKQEALGNLRPMMGTSIKEARLHVLNPTLRWPGTGGYWSGCDINLVEVVG